MFNFNLLVLVMIIFFNFILIIFKNFLFIILYLLYNFVKVFFFKIFFIKGVIKKFKKIKCNFDIYYNF